MGKKDLIQENEFLLKENKRLLHKLGVLTIQLNETKRIQNYGIGLIT